jgi:hypothetical protein
VLALIDELLTIGARKPPTTRFEHDDANADSRGTTEQRVSG